MVGPRKAILTSVPRGTTVKLIDNESEFDKVESHELLAVIMQDTNPSTVVEAKESTEIRVVPLTFNGSKTLKVQLNLWKKAILDLKRLNKVKASLSELAIKWLLALGKGEEFKDEVAE